MTTNAQIESGNGWVNCRCGQKHWGLYGAAGLFLVRTDHTGQFTEVVLQHRSLWSHQGGTWAVPGGALDHGETAFEGAVREAQEEAGIAGHHVTELAQVVLDHGDWSYTTVIAQTQDPQAPIGATDAESIEIAWVPLSQIRSRLLLPAFDKSLDQILALLAAVHTAPNPQP